MEILAKENVRILKGASDWKDAIRKSVEALEEGGFVEARYKEEIIGNVEKMGPYIVMAPNIALPHARPEQGVNKTQMAITLFKEDISFGENKVSAKLFITMAAADDSTHLSALVKVSEVLQDEKIVEELLHAENPDTIFQYFK